MRDNQTKYLIRLSHSGTVLILSEKVSDNPLKSKDIGFIYPNSIANVLERNKVVGFFLKLNKPIPAKVSIERKKGKKVIRYAP